MTPSILRSTLGRRGLILLAIGLIATLVQAGPAPAVAQYQLLFSASPDRSSASPLDGATLAGDVFAFVTGDSPSAKVRFFIDDPDGRESPFHVDRQPPFDLVGRDDAGLAEPLDTTSLSPGEHVVSAIVRDHGSREALLEATVTVDQGDVTNAEPAPDPTPTETATSEPAPSPSSPATTDPADSDRPVVHVTAPTDGRDATAAILDSVAGARDGSTIVFKAGARYRVDGELGIQDRHDLIFEGNGAVFYTDDPGDRGRQHWRFDTGSDIEVRNMTVRGPYAQAGVNGAWDGSREHQAAFHVRDVDGFELHGVKVRNVYGDALFLGGKQDGSATTDPTTWTRDVHVYDFHFEGMNRQGIAIIAARNVMIENGYIGNTHLNIFDPEPNNDGDGYVNITFRDNTVGPAGTKFVTVTGHGAHEAHDVFIVNNKLVGVPMRVMISSVTGPRKYNIVIHGNVSDTVSREKDPNNPNSYPWVFRCRYTDDVQITDNVQPLASGMKLYSEQDCTETVSGNDT